MNRRTSIEFKCPSIVFDVENDRMSNAHNCVFKRSISLTLVIFIGSNIFFATTPEDFSLCFLIPNSPSTRIQTISILEPLQVERCHPRVVLLCVVVLSSCMIESTTSSQKHWEMCS